MPRVKIFGINLGRAVFVNTGRSAGKNDPVWLFAGNGVGRSIEADDLRINLELANAPADDLGVLRTEIEDENFGMLRRGFGLHVNHG